MKKLITLILIVAALGAESQIYQPQQSNGFQYKRLKIDSALHIPTFCGTPIFRGMAGTQDSATAALGFDSCNHLLYVYDPQTKTWITVEGGGGSPVRDTVDVDYDLYTYFDSTGRQHIARLLSDGLVDGGIIFWKHDLVFGSTPGHVVINHVLYTFPEDSTTLDPADPTFSRVDIFVYDTLGLNHVTGVADGNLVTPQPGDLEIQLTQGIQINPGDTSPSSLALKLWYDENVGPTAEATMGTVGTITVNFNNTDNPYRNTKAAFISSYNTGARITMIRASNDTVLDGKALLFNVYLNVVFGSTHSLRVQFFNGTTPVSSVLTFNNTFGLNPNQINQYQTIAIPLNALTWPGGTIFNRIYLTMIGTDNSGSGGLYIDYVRIQSGIYNINPQTDYSNKVDSVRLRNDSLFQYIKGIVTYKGKATGGGSSGNYHLPYNGVATDYLGGDSALHNLPDISGKLNISDTSSMLTPYVRSIVLNTPNVLFSTPVNFPVTTHTATGSLTLNNQAAYTNFGNNTASSATPTFFTNNFSDSLRRIGVNVSRRVNGVWINQYTDSTAGGAGSTPPLSSVLLTNNQTKQMYMVVDSTATDSSGLNYFELRPRNYGRYYGANGRASGFIQGYAYYPNVNPGSYRPMNVVGLMWGYNGGFNSPTFANEPSWGFRTETNFGQGGGLISEFHLPEFKDSAGLSRRLNSYYVVNRNGYTTQTTQTDALQMFQGATDTVMFSVTPIGGTNIGVNQNGQVFGYANSRKPANSYTGQIQDGGVNFSVGGTPNSSAYFAFTSPIQVFTNTTYGTSQSAAIQASVGTASSYAYKVVQSGIGTSSFGGMIGQVSTTGTYTALWGQNGGAGGTTRALIGAGSGSAGTAEYDLTDFGTGVSWRWYIKEGDTRRAMKISHGTTTYDSIMTFMGSTGVNAGKVKVTTSFAVGQTEATSNLQSYGSFAMAYIAKAVDYTATISDCMIALTVTAKTITLPTAVGITGRVYTIKLTASGSGTVATTSSETIDGSTTYSLSAQYKYVTVQSDGANWNIIANN